MILVLAAYYGELQTYQGEYTTDSLGKMRPCARYGRGPAHDKYIVLSKRSIVSYTSQHITVMVIVSMPRERQVLGGVRPNSGHHGDMLCFVDCSLAFS